MDSLKFHPDTPCPHLLRLTAISGVALRAGRCPAGRLLPLWTPDALRLCDMLQGAWAPFISLHLPRNIILTLNLNPEDEYPLSSDFHANKSDSNPSHPDNDNTMTPTRHIRTMTPSNKLNVDSQSCARS
jgi:hypothetical protein